MSAVIWQQDLEVSSDELEELGFTHDCMGLSHDAEVEERGESADTDEDVRSLQPRADDGRRREDEEEEEEESGEVEEFDEGDDDADDDEDDADDDLDDDDDDDDFDDVDDEGFDDE